MIFFGVWSRTETLGPRLTSQVQGRNGKFEHQTGWEKSFFSV